MGPGFGEHIARSLVAALFFAVLIAFAAGVLVALGGAWLADHLHVAVKLAALEQGGQS